MRCNVNDNDDNDNNAVVPRCDWNPFTPSPDSSCVPEVQHCASYLH